MSKLILNVSDKAYTTEEIEKFLEKEQKFREILNAKPFVENLESWKILEIFPDDLDDWTEEFEYLMPKMPKCTIPWNLNDYLVKVYFKEGNNYLQVAEEQRKIFTNLCKGKTDSYVIDKLYEDDILVIQDDLLRYPKNWVSSINEFIAYGAAINKEYLINQYFEILD